MSYIKEKVVNKEYTPLPGLVEIQDPLDVAEQQDRIKLWEQQLPPQPQQKEEPPPSSEPKPLSIENLSNFLYTRLMASTLLAFRKGVGCEFAFIDSRTWDYYVEDYLLDRDQEGFSMERVKQKEEEAPDQGYIVRWSSPGSTQLHHLQNVYTINFLTEKKKLGKNKKVEYLKSIENFYLDVFRKIPPPKTPQDPPASNIRLAHLRVGFQERQINNMMLRWRGFSPDKLICMGENSQPLIDCLKQWGMDRGVDKEKGYYEIRMNLGTTPIQQPSLKFRYKYQYHYPIWDEIESIFQHSPEKGKFLFTRKRWRLFWILNGEQKSTRRYANGLIKEGVVDTTEVPETDFIKLVELNVNLIL